MPKLRHAGVLVKDLKKAVDTYLRLGFTPTEPLETLWVQKMRDKAGNTIELVQGNWHPHIAVDWYEDTDGNYIELVRDK